MPGRPHEVLAANGVVSGARGGRAARGGGRRLSALPGANALLSRPPGTGGRSPGAGSPAGGGARRGRDAAAALPFLSLPAPQPRGCSRRRHGQCPGAEGSAAGGLGGPRGPVPPGA